MDNRSHADLYAIMGVTLDDMTVLLEETYELSKQVDDLYRSHQWLSAVIDRLKQEMGWIK